MATSMDEVVACTAVVAHSRSGSSLASSSSLESMVTYDSLGTESTEMCKNSLETMLKESIVTAHTS